MNKESFLKKDSSMTGLKTLVITMFVYIFLGLIFGVIYREVTKLGGFVDPITGISKDSVLSIVHTHLLTLGAVAFALITLFEKMFKLSSNSLFKIFYIVYNVGLIIVVILFVVRGVFQLYELPLTTFGSSAISGVAGLGHAILALAFVLLAFIAFQIMRTNKKQKSNDEISQPQAS